MDYLTYGVVYDESEYGPESEYYDILIQRLGLEGKDMTYIETAFD